MNTFYQLRYGKVRRQKKTFINRGMSFYFAFKKRKAVKNAVEIITGGSIRTTITSGMIREVAISIMVETR